MSGNIEKVINNYNLLWWALKFKYMIVIKSLGFVDIFFNVAVKLELFFFNK